MSPRLTTGFRVGLGYRRSLHDELMAAPADAIDFVELAPENYFGLGGNWRRRLRAVRARWPVITHGLALSLAGIDPLDARLVDGVAAFTGSVESPWYSDHICQSSAAGSHSHELLPVPLTRARARHTARRVREVASALPVPMAVENISAYGRWPEDALSEPDFVREIMESADCGLLFDVNNLYVNAMNFGLDPWKMLARMPLERTVQIHIAGFAREGEDLLIDTHGRPIADPVWPLLEATLERTGPVPVLLERDHNIPPLGVLLREIAHIRAIGARVFGQPAPTHREVAHVA